MCLSEALAQLRLASGQKLILRLRTLDVASQRVARGIMDKLAECPTLETACAFNPVDAVLPNVSPETLQKAGMTLVKLNVFRLTAEGKFVWYKPSIGAGFADERIRKNLYQAECA